MTNDEKPDIECPVEEEQTMEQENAALPRYWSAEEVRELLARAFADFVGVSCDAVRLEHSDAGAEMMNILAAQDYRMTVEDMLDGR